MTYQREHWFNDIRFFAGNVMRILTEYLDFKPGMTFYMWLPLVIGLIVILAVLFYSRKKLKPSYLAYAIAYTMIVISGGWPLSALRYYSALFPVAVGLGLICDTRPKRIVTLCLCALIQLVFIYGYTNSIYVM
jgi:hypothetical protein